ncbi:MAG: FAD-binding oxidoreductase [Spirochaetes bacterium]|nr:FAD-binding oxidoreductase [Spirochaetota bacterium]
MAINQETIVKDLTDILGRDQVVADPQVLRENSQDRFLRYATHKGVFIRPTPAAVVMVNSTKEISDVLRYCNDNKVNVIPRTGQSATEGGLEVVKKNTVIVDASGMNKILKIDPVNMQATGQCGVPLEILEDQLRAQGLTTGHSPQSKPLAQLGGLTATRSIGQFSTLYGGIEDMIIGLEAVFPVDGRVVRIKNVPRRAAGPDLRHVIIGNEGALCFITEVTVKIHKYMPENYRYFGFTVDDMKTALNMLRAVVVEGYRPSVARAYDPEDGKQHGFDQFAGDKHVVIFLAEGPKGITEAMSECIEKVAQETKGCNKIDSRYIQTWFENLNWGPEKIDEEAQQIKETNHIGHTTEISGTWDVIHEIYANSIHRIRKEFPYADHLTMLGGHSSHSYINGTNLYFVYDYNVVDCAPEEEVSRYHLPIKTIIVEEVLKAGGSICHHHGAGKYRAPWMDQEHGTSYWMLEKLKEVFDPNEIMNYGTLFKVDSNN